MSCHKTKKIYEEMCEYLGEDLDHPMCKQLKKHVENCPDCKNYLDSIKKSIILFKKASSDKEVPEDKLKGLLNKLKESGRGKIGKNSSC